MLFCEIEDQIAAGSKAARLSWDRRAYVVRDNRPREILRVLYPGHRYPDGQGYLCVSEGKEAPFVIPDDQLLCALGTYRAEDDWVILDPKTGVPEVAPATCCPEKTGLVSLRTLATRLRMDPSALRKLAIRMGIIPRRGRTSDSNNQAALVFTSEQVDRIENERAVVDVNDLL